MLTLHYLQDSQAIRILWLLEELELKQDVDYKLVTYTRQDDLTAPPELKVISPLQTSPVITDNDDDLVLAESNAILDYIIDKYMRDGTEQQQQRCRQLRPSSTSSTGDRANFLFWYHAGPTSFQHVLQTDTLLSLIPTKVPFMFRPIVSMVMHKAQSNYVVPRITTILQYMEQQLQSSSSLGTSLLAGTSRDQITLADISVLYSLESALTRYDFPKSQYPHVHAYHEKVRAWPSLQRALQTVGQDSIVVTVHK